MTARKATIFPQISQAANELLQRTCDAQGCAPGVVVEAALYALLDPQEVTGRDGVLLQGLMQVHEDLVAMLGFHKKILALLEAQHTASAEIATFDQMYREEAETDVDDEEGEALPVEEIAPQPGRWRVFRKKEKGAQ